MSDPSCNACSGTWPSSDHFIADLGLSMAYLHEDQFFPGWTVLVFKRHATELFHLAPTERIQLMEEVSRLAKVLTETFDARKMNYGLLGNQTPHIHWHLIPRLASDPAPLEPVWRIPHDRLALSADQVQTTIARIKQRL
ncbi:MAG TPA: HIT family protein [Nitrospira sp.]|jgi:diadenosine tetraphosphate (Ap4A) HIT family hydrolase